jgi:prepilin-type N-terminal cleavage/methylation domain-containing protein
MPRRAMSFSVSRMDTRYSSSVLSNGLCAATRAAVRTRRGVTLVEALVVLAVLAVVVGLTLPKLDSARFRADANVRQVRVALQEAQRLSQERQHDVIVSFDIAGGRIRLLEDTDNNHSVTAGEPVAWRGLTGGGHFTVPAAGISGSVTSPVAGNSVATLDGMPTITFHRSGSASSSVEVYLQVDGGNGKAVRAVTVAQSTGRTQWFTHTGEAWKTGR